MTTSTDELHACPPLAADTALNWSVGEWLNCNQHGLGCKVAVQGEFNLFRVISSVSCNQWVASLSLKGQPHELPETEK